ncbi:MAG: molybdate ABC transporter permease subunit [Pseudomonadota bacterium]
MADTFLSPEAWEAVLLSLKVAGAGTLASLPVAVGVAALLAHGRFPGRMLLDGLVHLPLVLPPVVTGYVLLVLFGRQGTIGAFLEAQLGLVFAFRWTGAALAGAIMGFPLMVRAIRLSMEAVDARLGEAAATLGAGATMRFVLITAPLITPGILAGTILCFAKALGEFGATITFVSNIPGETRTLPSAIYAFLQVPGGEREAAVLATAAVVIALAALFLSDTVSRRVARAIGMADEARPSRKPGSDRHPR